MNLNRLDAHQPMTDTKHVLDTNSSIAQSFTSRYNDLNIVSICLRNDSRLLTPLNFELFEATTSGSPVRTIAFSGGNVDEVDCTRLQFEPIADSMGKAYIARITAVQAGVGKAGFADPLNPLRSMHVEAAAENNYPYGIGYVDGMPLGYDLHFKTFYRQEVGVVARESVEQFIERLPRDPLFMVPYLILIYVIGVRFFKRTAS